MFHSQRTFHESKRFRCLKYGTGTMVSIFYLLYLTYLIIQVTNDEPLLIITHEVLQKIDIPVIEICGIWSEVIISRCVFTWDDNHITSFDNCNVLHHNNTKKYCHTYTNDNKEIYYGNSEVNLTKPWVRNIDFYFQIVNITNVTSHSLSVGTISGQLIDPETYKKDPTKSAGEFYLKENAFAGIQNMTTIITFKKTTLRKMLPHDASIVIGENTNYKSTHYLILKSKDFPMHPNDSLTDTGHFAIAPTSFIHEVKSEKRSHTILGAMGLAGGAFGVVNGIFALLFGQSRLNPWGVVRRAEKLKTAFNADLQNYPFISTINPTQDPNLSTLQRVKRLENRILELENILTDVFDPNALKRLANNM